jgi:alginate O-acetyltransferase complex protein AlgI
MLFNSIEFLIFFSIVVVLYFSIAHKYRWVLLLAASYYFYMSWKAEYILLILFTTSVTYACSILMDKTKTLKKRKLFLYVSLTINLGVLFFFKYFNVLNNELSELLRSYSIQYNYEGLNIILPLGISFYTFQTIGYNLDVFYGVRKPEKHFGVFALYVSFFPQLIAGPIERTSSLLPQFYEKHKVDFQRFFIGFKYILWGLFKKIVIADRLVPYINEGFNNVDLYSGSTLLFATFLFAIQLYADFSAYSEMAKGIAKIMGFDLMQNFNHPFISKNITEFWRRWHISLSFWLRDYLYMPLLFSKKKWGQLAAVYALFITFILVGIWHGSKVTFLILGLLQAIALVYELYSKKWRDKISKRIPLVIYNNVSIFLTFLYVLYSFSFFKVHSLSDALIMNKAFFTSLFEFDDLFLFAAKVGGSRFIFSMILCFMFIIFDIWIFKQIVKQKDGSINKFILYPFILALILLFGYFGEVEFIYFQF